jgi:organic radical activating enzyme
MRINEIFESIQGEGTYTGYPCLFIRLSGCNRNCSFCDTKYHTDGIDYSINNVIDLIKDSNQKIVVFTGGEPMLQIKDIRKIIRRLPEYDYHIETNGDFPIDILDFDYVSFSPKDMVAMNKVIKLTEKWPNYLYDIKVVTDLKLNKDLIPYATMLMPLTTYNNKKDIQIERDIWNYCVKNSMRFCSRIQVHIWGVKRGK